MTPAVEEWVKAKKLKVGEKDEQGSTLAHFASSDGRVDALVWLKEQGVDVNGKDDFGQTPMFVATRYGHIDVMKWLWQQGADVNAQDDNGETPLFAAVHARQKNSLSSLLHNGADVRIRNKEGKTVWRVASDIYALGKEEKTSEQLDNEQMIFCILMDMGANFENYETSQEAPDK